VGHHLVRRVSGFGFEASYPTLTREIRARRLRPVCADCGRATERVNAIIPPDLLNDLPEDKWNREIEPQEDDVPELCANLNGMRRTYRSHPSLRKPTNPL
jgi:hypothetical protein